MRRPAIVVLGVGVALLVLSLVLFFVLTQFLMSCPNPGVCHSELIWESLVPSTTALALGAAALVAAWLLNRRRSSPAESS